MDTYQIMHTSPWGGDEVSYVQASSPADAVGILCAMNVGKTASDTPTILSVGIVLHKKPEPWMVYVWVNGVQKKVTVRAFGSRDAVRKAIACTYKGDITITVGSVIRQ